MENHLDRYVVRPDENGKPAIFDTIRDEFIWAPGMKLGLIGDVGHLNQCYRGWIAWNRTWKAEHATTIALVI